MESNLFSTVIGEKRRGSGSPTTEGSRSVFGCLRPLRLLHSQLSYEESLFVGRGRRLNVCEANFTLSEAKQFDRPVA